MGSASFRRNGGEGGFAEFTVELMQVIGPVSQRRMFGGHGLFLDGLMFALIADSTLYLKVDDGNRRQFEALGLPPFEYVRHGKRMNLSYRQAPEEVFEHADAMAHWAGSAFAAALRAAASQRRRKPPGAA